MTRSRVCTALQLVGALLFFTALYDLVGPEWAGMALGLTVVLVATLAERAGAAEPARPSWPARRRAARSATEARRRTERAEASAELRAALMWPRPDGTAPASAADASVGGE